MHKRAQKNLANIRRHFDLMLGQSPGQHNPLLNYRPSFSYRGLDILIMRPPPVPPPTYGSVQKSCQLTEGSMLGFCPNRIEAKFTVGYNVNTLIE